MSKSVKLTSFGSQSLHNSTGTIKNVQVRDEGPVVIPSLMPTVNSAYYDVEGGAANSSLPGTIEVDLIVRGTGAASLAALDGNILGLRLTRDTLTGEDVNGTELTCTARCVSVPSVSTVTTFGAWRQTYTLRFQKVTEWS